MPGNEGHCVDTRAQGRSDRVFPAPVKWATATWYLIFPWLPVERLTIFWQLIFREFTRFWKAFKHGLESIENETKIGRIQNIGKCLEKLLHFLNYKRTTILNCALSRGHQNLSQDSSLSDTKIFPGAAINPIWIGESFKKFYSFAPTGHEFNFIGGMKWIWFLDLLQSVSI